MSTPLFGRKAVWSQLADQEKRKLLERPALGEKPELRAQVQAIIEKVRQGGDAALVELTERYDRARLSRLSVSERELQTALDSLAKEDRDALELARDQIARFHQAQLPRALDLETAPGVRCERQSRPIDPVGLYAPGGTAPLPSSVLMLAVPAQIAGCARRVLCTPPRADGTVSPVILAAARLCGLEEVYKLGGAQAIAALAYGTETVPKTQKIFGPGNAWVTEAKLLASQDPRGAACDLPAGPSELLVIADENANPEFAAADLLSQAEHGTDSQVVLVAIGPKTADPILKAAQTQLAELPRAKIAREALSKSIVIVAGSRDEALVASNAYAPEHLILMVENPRELIPGVQNAGSVFVGAWSPESAGDYASGTNHVLPTYGYARAHSGLSIDSFLKQITFQELEARGIRKIGPAIERLAALEGLDAHRLAVTRRLAALSDEGRRG